MRFPRSCGTLVHPTSFPGKYGAGDFGREAHEFLDFLSDTGQTIWQVLPLTPPGSSHSPYAGSSAFAGNIFLISIDKLVEKNLLTAEEAASATLPESTIAEFGAAKINKNRLFEVAARRFFERLADDSNLRKVFEAFKIENDFWLKDYALFTALSQNYDGKPWNTWPSELVKRKPKALEEAEIRLKEMIERTSWLQFEFHTQWQALKAAANSKNIRIIGDIPIFVDHNSADVWANQDYFELDRHGKRKLVAGVPPDYFSATGQLWGNPLYNWKVLEKEDYSWWMQRFKHNFQLYNAVRLDHFRGFEAYWEIKASAETAEHGRWVKGPGEKFFSRLSEHFGELPIIAEDLGIITEAVKQLRDAFNLPGMKVLQFAFNSGPENEFLPHNYPQNSVVYTGTHDNDTSIGWYLAAPEIEKHRARVYTRSNGYNINWELIRLAMFSSADQAIFPIQDFLNLNASGRMNIPGTAVGNWQWRYTGEQLLMSDKAKIQNLVKQTNR